MLNPFTNRRVLEEGMPARATIVAMSMPHSGATWQNIRMTLDVAVEGRAPYRLEGQWLVPRSATLGWGMALPAKVDPSDQDKLAIDWDLAEQEHDAAMAATPPGGGLEGLLGGLGAGQGMGANTVIDARGNPEIREQILGALHQAGVDMSAAGQAGGPGAAGATGAAAPDQDDPLEKIEKLAALRDKGIVTDEEFQAKKRELLGEL